MTGWKFVENKRLVVGGGLPEGCALVPAQASPEIGTIVLRGGWDSGELWKVVDTYGRGKSTIQNDKGERQEWYTNSLYRVVEPVPAAPQKLGRMPKVGETFWIEAQCESIRETLTPYATVVRIESHTAIWLHESLLGIDLSAKRTEVANLRAKLAELEAELKGGE